MDKIISGQSFLYRENGYHSTVLEVEMKNRIRGDLLQVALGKSIERFPYLSKKLVEKHGSYYLYRDDVSMNAIATNKLRTLGCMQTGYHLLDITFTGNSIRVAFHHALCDGRGIKPFVETLIYYYCTLRYKKAFTHQGIRTIEDPIEPSESMEPLQDQLYEVHEGNIIKVDQDGFALPEISSNTTKCNRTILQVKEADFIKVCKQYGATPASMAAILMSSAIYRQHPKANKSIVCSMACDLREVAGMPLTHRNCTASMYLPYGTVQNESTIEAVAQSYRKLLTQQKNKDNAYQKLNQQIQLFQKVEAYHTLAEKKAMLSFFDQLCVNTYVISYLGKMQFQDFDQYVVGTHLYTEGIKGMTVNMVAAGGMLSFDILQGFSQTTYVQAFLNQMTTFGIAYEAKATRVVITGKDKSHKTASHQGVSYRALQEG